MKRTEKTFYTKYWNFVDTQMEKERGWKRMLEEELVKKEDRIVEG